MNLSVLIDSSGELAFIYAIGFIISLYLIHLISIQISDVTRLKLITVIQTYPNFGGGKIWMRKLFVPWFVTK
jgi:hypothetical protein